MNSLFGRSKQAIYNDNMKRIVTILTLSALILAACNDSTNKTNSTIKQSIKSNNMTYPVRIINISINKSADAVYQFTSNPENFPKWVDFVKSLTKQGDIWIGKTDIGDIKIKFSPINNMGVLDHEVIFPDGQMVNNPMRVVANNNGCEFTFMLLWMPNRTEKEFNEDAKAVAGDLQKLKEILEH